MTDGTGHTTHDPFVVAWGEIETWRGSVQQARLLSGWSNDFVSWAPDQALMCARAIAQSGAIRRHILGQMDAITLKLKLPHLQRAMDAVRKSQKGPAVWRRYWLRRAVSYSACLTEEQHEIAAARSQIVSWSRCIDLTQMGVEAAAAVAWPDHVPTMAQSDHTNALFQLREAQAALQQLKTGAAELLEGAERLRRKAECMAEAKDVARDLDSDVLESPWLADVRGRAVQMPASGVLGSAE